MNMQTPRRKYRAIWISDIHIGTRQCRSDLLLDFLRWHDCETLYLVGDIIDGWSLRKNWFWRDIDNELVQRILQRANSGTEVVYVPGNHDEAAREYCGMEFAGVKVRQEVIHETADGRKLLIIHGDEFDSVVRYSKWLAHLGDTAYAIALSANHWLNVVRRRLGYPYWSLSAFLKQTVKNAVQYISRFEILVAQAARERGVDGVVCGHIHHAEMRDIDGILYCNDGDWVESCTALAERFDGSLEILHWADPAHVAQNARAMALAS
jgi:UDP-2,3-diacylglucosamine pyrophosphatase LpxH